MTAPKRPTRSAVPGTVVKEAHAGRLLRRGSATPVSRTAEEARSVGIDIDPQRVDEATANVNTAGVAARARILQGDLFESDIREATVVTLYLLSSLNQKLRPKLLADLQPGTRIVSHAFDMGDWKPEQTMKVGGTTIYLWRVPPRKV